MPNPLCHFEIMSSNVEQSKKFYGSVFDWQFDDSSMPGYSLINPGAEPSGGMFQMPEEAPGPCMNIYFQVDDINETVKKATSHGAKVLVESTEIPNIGWFAVMSDPEGIPFSLLQQNA